MQLLPSASGEKEPRGLVGVEGESGRAVAVRVSPEVDPAGDEPGLELRGAVAAGAECSERRRQVGREEEGRRGIRPESLLKAEEPASRRRSPARSSRSPPSRNARAPAAKPSTVFAIR